MSFFLTEKLIADMFDAIYANRGKGDAEIFAAARAAAQREIERQKGAAENFAANCATARQSIDAQEKTLSERQDDLGSTSLGSRRDKPEDLVSPSTGSAGG